MSTHRVETGTIAQIAVQAAQSTNQEETTMTTQHDDTNRPEFTSTRLMSRLGFVISGNIGKLATRIQKLANPPKGSTLNPDEVKAEIRECVAKLVWGYDNLGSNMRTVEDAVNEWCGGGYSRPRSDAQIAEVATALNISTDDAKMSAEANRLHSKDYLTIRRQGLAPVMVAKIDSILHGSVIEGIEPEDNIIEQACIATFQNAILWGDWAEAALVKDDAHYHLGKTLEIPKADKSMQQKADRIRNELANRQAEQAQKDAEALAAFDLDIAA